MVEDIRYNPHMRELGLELGTPEESEMREGREEQEWEAGVKTLGEGLGWRWTIWD